MFILNTEEILSPISADNYRREIFKEVFDPHGENSIVHVPPVDEARVAAVGAEVFVGVQELLFILISPELIHIVVFTIPFLSIIPRILQSDQVDFLRFASLARVLDHDSSNIEN